MRLAALLIVLILALVAGFAVNNWAAIVAPVPLDVGVATVQAPLGLVMLGLLVVVAVLLLATIAVAQARLLMEGRRHVKEMQAQRQLADQAEASRFTELRVLLQTEVAQLGARIAQSQEAVRTDLREHTNSLAAMIAEFDDRLGQRVPRAGGTAGAVTPSGHHPG